MWPIDSAELITRASLPNAWVIRDPESHTPTFPSRPKDGMVRFKKLVLAGSSLVLFVMVGVYFVGNAPKPTRTTVLTHVVKEETDSGLDEKLPQPFKQRRLLLNRKCRQLFTKSARRIIWEHFPHNQMIIDANRNFAYCSVEKAGSTFWKSIFAKLEGKMVPESTEIPIDVKSKDEIHGIFLYKLKNYSQQRAVDFLKRARLMLFVRDPYVRLTSAYMDKLFSTNHFYWTHIGKLIVSRVRRNPTERSLKCGHDVTFNEFLQYFVMSETRKSVPSDHHWKPIWRMCQPCALPYRYIGKSETFTSDAEQIIGMLSANSTIFLHDVSRRDAIIRDVSQYVMSVLQHLEEYKKCLTLPEILRRLWSLFVFKGYFKETEPFVLPNISKEEVSVNFETSLIHQFLNMTILKVKKSVRSNSLDSRRNRISREMFRNVSTSLCTDVQRLVHPDSVLFGYTKNTDICSQDATSSPITTIDPNWV